MGIDPTTNKILFKKNEINNSTKAGTTSGTSNESVKLSETLMDCLTGAAQNKDFKSPSVDSLVKSFSINAEKYSLSEEKVNQGPIVDGVRTGKDKNGNKTQTFYHGGKATTCSTYAPDGKTLVSEQKNTYGEDGARTNSRITNYAENGKTPKTIEDNVYCEDGETLYSTAKTTLAEDGVTPLNTVKTIINDNGKPAAVTTTEFAKDGKTILKAEETNYNELGMITNEKTFKNSPFIDSYGKPVMIKDKNGKDTDRPLLQAHMLTVNSLPDGGSETIEFTQSLYIKNPGNKKDLTYATLNGTSGDKRPLLDNQVKTTIRSDKGDLKESTTYNWSESNKYGRSINTKYNNKELKTSESVRFGKCIFNNATGEVENFQPKDDITDVIDYTKNGKPNTVKTDKNGKEIPQKLRTYKMVELPPVQVNVGYISKTDEQYFEATADGTAFVIDGEKVISGELIKKALKENVLFIEHDYNKKESTEYNLEKVNHIDKKIDEASGRYVRTTTSGVLNSPVGKPYKENKVIFNSDEY